MAYTYFKPGEVKINDIFWKNYLQNVRYKMIPYVFKKMEQGSFLANFEAVANGESKKHIGQPFSDGLLLETIRGVCDFLADEYDPVLMAYIDKVTAIISAAAEKEGGFLCTATTQDMPEKRFGENGGFLFWQHDLYNHGTLIEAAISHYNATGKTNFLRTAVIAANLICSEIGKPPKKNIIPGHSLPEEAFVKLYRLFRDDQNLKPLIKELNVKFEDYLEIAEFWYDARGYYEGRSMNEAVHPNNYQDHITFAKQREAVGHSVRAMLCYLGATVVSQEKDRTDFVEALNALWDNVVLKKLHISGGIGARHDIEGFAENYNLPNKAYLETCAAVGLAFWNTEMNIIKPDAKYFDCFERSLYNNILSAVGEDFNHFFYQNPLEADGSLRRWEWHTTPCCPPMLLKIFSSLSSYIYSFDRQEKQILINMYLDSSFKDEFADVELKDSRLYIDSFGREITLKFRIPEYVKDFRLTDGLTIYSCEYENGYAVLKGVFSKEKPVHIIYRTEIRRIYANPLVKEELGKVAVMYGPYVYCAEGFDNAGEVDFTLAENPEFRIKDEYILANAADGVTLKMIKYFKWCNRGQNDTDAKMKVWLNQENMKGTDYLAEKIDGKLYDTYE